MLFVPAFPDGGRTTCGGIHYVRVGDLELPAHESEYAHDPVFAFSTGVLVDYVGEKSSRLGINVALERSGRVSSSGPSPRRCLLPSSSRTSWTPAASPRSPAPWTLRLREAVASSAAPRLSPPSSPGSRAGDSCPHRWWTGPSACSSSADRTPSGRARSSHRSRRHGGAPAVVDTAVALTAPAAAGQQVADAARTAFAGKPVVILATERERSSEHSTLAHGERVMSALTTAVASLLPEASVVVAKGGITSAEVARTGIGASSSLVVGQVLPGVSVWRMSARDGRDVLYVVVPGNVGGAATLTRVLDALDVRVPVA
ncbi:MAG TPA: nucleotide-binding domain containing protein [Kineosporiaceae bacterium]|nr:nucleotide-binding domain containing protein [Kineosporiaceae bacterium]